MAFVYQRRIRFRDTDAAGVMYFTNALAICHEAYEESLLQFGFDLRIFFGSGDVAVPITQTSIDYRRPSYCGDVQLIHVSPSLRSDTEFDVTYELYGDGGEKLALMSQAQTRHVCIGRGDRKRTPLPDELLRWMDWCSRKEAENFRI